ncbi:MAG TPA: CCA tRNA nucleotidyltransferase [Actinomycetota bacterium]|nr:CCA tRNA nucleotidyltransferase [Actinomycetota bacterium]
MATSEVPNLSVLLAEGSPVMDLAGHFEKAGHELYLVGGPVRDALLGRPHADLDFATDATPDQTLAVVKPLAASLWLQGREFGTVGAEIAGIHMEITTFRTERYQPSSRRPDVEFAADITTDLSRRDFTVNAMAIQLPGMNAVDPFGGRDDLAGKVLRTPVDPDDSFSDDPLRMLRAFRFASQLDFQVAPEALDSITRLRDRLTTVSAERIRDELSKLLVGAAPAHGLGLADRTGLSDLFLPELASLKLEQDPVHRHKDVFRHTLAVVEKTPPVLVLRLAALLHDVGKPRTRRIGPEGVSFHHHEVVGAKMAEARLRELRYPNEIVDQVRTVIFLHHRFHTYRLGWTDSAVRRYVRDAGPLLGTLNELVRADCTTRDAAKAKRLAARMDELEERIAELAAREELEKIRPDLDGFQVMAYLGLPGGPVIKKALDHLLEIRLDEGPLGQDEAYARLDSWARAEGIEPAGERVPARKKKSAQSIREQAND